MGSCVRSVCVIMFPRRSGGGAVDNGRRDSRDAARRLSDGSPDSSQPLADDAGRPDPVAQFFLALVYHNPHGGRFDQLRACGLFLRSASRAHPFAEQSAALAADVKMQLQDGASLCVAEERWGSGTPQAFELGPGHRIVFADTSIPRLRMVTRNSAA